MCQCVGCVWVVAGGLTDRLTDARTHARKYTRTHAHIQARTDSTMDAMRENKRYNIFVDVKENTCNLYIYIHHRNITSCQTSPCA